MQEAAAGMRERLRDIARGFETVLILGPADDSLCRWLRKEKQSRHIIVSDLAPALPGATSAHIVAADEEALPFAESRFDLVLGLLTLHWVNDLPGTLIQINRSLKPDGLFIGAMFGGDSLGELRDSLTAAEIETEDGLSPRVSPFVRLNDAAGLLHRAGFAMPVADSDSIDVRYANLFRLAADLRGMGETNAIAQRERRSLRRQTVLRGAEIYQRRYGDDAGRLRATFELLWLTGWAPHPDQPKPKRPGSATARLADALGVEEIPAGDKAKP